MEELFRVKGGNFSSSSQTFTDVTGASKLDLTFYKNTIAYHLSISGHWVDGAGKTMRFRIKLVDPNTQAHYYWPSEQGQIKFMYVDHSRLEEVSLIGVVNNVPVNIPLNLQLQVACGSEGGLYSWNSVYGEMILIIW